MKNSSTNLLLPKSRAWAPAPVRTRKPQVPTDKTRSSHLSHMLSQGRLFGRETHRQTVTFLIEQGHCIAKRQKNGDTTLHITPAGKAWLIDHPNVELAWHYGGYKTEQGFVSTTPDGELHFAVTLPQLTGAGDEPYFIEPKSAGRVRAAAKELLRTGTAKYLGFLRTQDLLTPENTLRDDALTVLGSAPIVDIELASLLLGTPVAVGWRLPSGEVFTDMKALIRHVGH